MQAILIVIIIIAAIVGIAILKSKMAREKTKKYVIDEALDDVVRICKDNTFIGKEASFTLEDIEKYINKAKKMEIMLFTGEDDSSGAGSKAAAGYMGGILGILIFNALTSDKEVKSKTADDELKQLRIATLDKVYKKCSDIVDNAELRSFSISDMERIIDELKRA